MRHFQQSLCLICLILLFCLVGCIRPATNDKYLPNNFVRLNEKPELFLRGLLPRNQNLTSWLDLQPSLQKSLVYVQSKNQEQIAENLTNTWGDLNKTLTKLIALLPHLDKNPQLLLDYFHWQAINGGINYTGYYAPSIRASREKKPGYEQPLYKRPPELNSFIAKKGRYHDRATIENDQVLAGRNLELAWVADPLDAYYLKIQGSGILHFDDGTWSYVNYAGHNRHKYISSGRIMREMGLIKTGKISEQRQWFKDNPHRITEILNKNPSYVFFKFGTKGAIGSMGHPVDDWISLATDRKLIPLGSVVAYGVNIPEEHGLQALRGIGLAHDVGGAIRKNRIDIFCGWDKRATHIAGHLDAKGPAWILLANERELSPEILQIKKLPHSIFSKNCTGIINARLALLKLQKHFQHFLVEYSHFLPELRQILEQMQNQPIEPDLFNYFNLANLTNLSDLAKSLNVTLDE